MKVPPACGHGKELDALRAKVERLREALMDLVRGAAITFSDERIGYEEIQVDRGALNRARAALAPEDQAMSAPTCRELLDSSVGNGSYDAQMSLAAIACRTEAVLLILSRYRAPAMSGCYDAALIAQEIQAALDGVKP